MHPHNVMAKQFVFPVYLLSKIENKLRQGGYEKKVSGPVTAPLEFEMCVSLGSIRKALRLTEMSCCYGN